MNDAGLDTTYKDAEGRLKSKSGIHWSPYPFFPRSPGHV